jgi:hypothetical protein
MKNDPGGSSGQGRILGENEGPIVLTFWPRQRLAQEFRKDLQ